MPNNSDSGRLADDLAGLIKLRPKLPPKEEPKAFPSRALRYGVGQAPLIPDKPDALDW